MEERRLGGSKTFGLLGGRREGPEGGLWRRSGKSHKESC